MGKEQKAWEARAEDVAAIGKGSAFFFPGLRVPGAGMESCCAPGPCSHQTLGQSGVVDAQLPPGLAVSGQQGVRPEGSGEGQQHRGIGGQLKAPVGKDGWCRVPEQGRGRTRVVSQRGVLGAMVEEEVLLEWCGWKVH